MSSTKEEALKSPTIAKRHNLLNKQTIGDSALIKQGKFHTFLDILLHLLVLFLIILVFAYVIYTLPFDAINITSINLPFERYRVLTTPVIRDNQLIGVLQVGLSLRDIDEAIAKL